MRMVNDKGEAVYYNPIFKKRQSPVGHDDLIPPPILS